MGQRHTVRAEWDADAAVWVVGKSDIPGLFVESETFDGFIANVRDAAPFLLDLGPTASLDIAVHAEATVEIRPRPLDS